MNEKQLKLLSQRLIHDIVNSNESENLKIKRNKIFCKRFFGKEIAERFFFVCWEDLYHP